MSKRTELLKTYDWDKDEADFNRAFNAYQGKNALDFSPADTVQLLAMITEELARLRQVQRAMHELINESKEQNHDTP